MHPSSLDNMQTCYQRYVVPAGLAARTGVTVLDLGGADVNGSYRPIFAGPQFAYRTADIAAGSGVDLVLEDPYRIPLPDASMDIVLSGQMLEHCEFFWLTFREMVRVLKPAGFIFLIAPSAGPIHRHPVDCYRFYPDAYAALAKYAGCHLHEVWRDERGPWQDLVGVFGKRPLPPAVADAASSLGAGTPLAAPVPIHSRPEEEVIAGQADYLDVLERIHQRLQPRRYLEIGVRHGRSLALAACPAVGVDPAPEVDRPLAPTTQIVTATSDRFFEAQAAAVLEQPLDLVFIDGLHLFEFALRDFMNVERWATPTTLVVIDDIFPNHPRQGLRNRTTRVWSGDVWRLHQCLRAARPDLVLLPLDTRPTGLLLVAGLDAHHRLLWERYNPLVRQYRDQQGEVPPDDVLRRQGAIAPDAAVVNELLGLLRALRDAAPPGPAVAAELRALRAGGLLGADR